MSLDTKYNDADSSATVSNGNADLLQALDILVRRDKQAPGFRALICVGIQEETETRWWEAKISGTGAQASFVSAPNPKADAILLLGRSEAESILRTGMLPSDPELIAVQGDRALLHKLISRYASPSISVSVLKNKPLQTPKDSP